MTSTQRSKAMYHRRRAALIARLGGKCVYPGCDETERLELHHEDNGARRHWRQMNRWTRIKHYEEDAEKGMIQLLCHAHHTAVGNNGYKNKGIDHGQDSGPVQSQEVASTGKHGPEDGKVGSVHSG